MPEQDELHVDGCSLAHPVDIIDKKVQRWHSLWQSSSASYEDILHACELIRQHAQVEQLEQLAVQDLRRALAKTKARAGMGVDRLSPTDFA
eukprot:6260799-Pyramimonas_sp.AAC.1